MAVLSGVKRSNMDWLMRVYPDVKVATQINKTTKITNQFPRTMRAVNEGEKFAVPIETELSDAGGYRNEDDDVPTPDRVKGAFGYATYDLYERTVRLTGASRMYGGSFVAPLEREVRGLVEAARLDRERDLFLPKRGEHATCTSASDATTIVVDSWQYVHVGLRVDVLLLSNGTVGDGVLNATISAVSRNLTTGAATLTISKNLANFAGIDSTYGIFRTNEYGKKPFGLPDIVDSSNPATENYLEIDRTTTTLWQAYEKAAGSQSASGQLFASMQTQLEIDGDDPAGLILTHLYVENDLIKQGVNDKLYLGTRDFELWGRRVTVNNVPVVGTRFCPFDTAYFLNLNYWDISHPPDMSAEGQWDMHGGPDGGTRFSRVANKWAHEALWVQAIQRICRRPNAQGKITGLAWHPDGTVA